MTALLVFTTSGITASESFSYRAELNSALTLFTWAMVGTVSFTSREIGSCPGGGDCRQTEVWMTSESAPALESLYPLRYLYRTAYDPRRQQTLAFEELRNRRGAEHKGRYPWRHRMIWLQGREDGAIRYDLDDKGETPPAEVSAWIHDGSSAASGSLLVKNSREVPMTLPAVDRLGGLDILRAKDLKPGMSWTQAGAGPKGSLTFRVTVGEKEIIETASRQWSAWKLRVEEHRHREGAQNPPPLYVWIADDAARTPVRFSIHHLVGRIRLSIE